MNPNLEYRTRFMIQGDYYEELPRRRSQFKVIGSHQTDVPIEKKAECTDNPHRDDRPQTRFK
jgi:hypothetical protein